MPLMQARISFLSLAVSSPIEFNTVQLSISSFSLRPLRLCGSLKKLTFTKSFTLNTKRIAIELGSISASATVCAVDTMKSTSLIACLLTATSKG
ncbi:MAG: hypothetical protein RMX97_04035 [Nostoc sp. DedQUE11]|nr:hypothetical protein [Nostoc sp. DedQUE11]